METHLKTLMRSHTVESLRAASWDHIELWINWDERRAEQTAQREESQRASERHEAQETGRLRAVAAVEAAAAAAERARAAGYMYIRSKGRTV